MVVWRTSVNGPFVSVSLTWLVKLLLLVELEAPVIASPWLLVVAVFVSTSVMLVVSNWLELVSVDVVVPDDVPLDVKEPVIALAVCVCVDVVDDAVLVSTETVWLVWVCCWSSVVVVVVVVRLVPRMSLPDSVSELLVVVVSASETLSVS